ncbi:hypothetical protein RB653_011181 (mitochondrion) [Dictyostelium firmibasis]|uniref:Uncharacterized protein n=1 Tax=Dictyostelium firmibasis TaxID=79012 RepID=A0AAN7YUU7_9MYCE
MIVNVILGLILIIGLIAKEEIALNEELVISISFIITIMIIKTMIKDSANDAFKSRAEEQENEFLTQGKKVIHIYSQLITYAKGLLETTIIDNTLVYAETMHFAKEGIKTQQLSNKVASFIDLKLKNYSNIMLTEVMQKEIQVKK